MWKLFDLHSNALAYLTGIGTAEQRRGEDFTPIPYNTAYGWGMYEFVNYLYTDGKLEVNVPEKIKVRKEPK